MSNQFEKLNEILWNMDWYKLLIKMQKIVLISMANRQQQAAAIQGFGNVQWTSKTFRQVLWLLAFFLSVFKNRLISVNSFIRIGGQKCIFLFYDASPIQITFTFSNILRSIVIWNFSCMNWNKFQIKDSKFQTKIWFLRVNRCKHRPITAISFGIQIDCTENLNNTRF